MGGAQAEFKRIEVELSESETIGWKIVDAEDLDRRLDRAGADGLLDAEEDLVCDFRLLKPGAKYKLHSKRHGGPEKKGELADISVKLDTLLQRASIEHYSFSTGKTGKQAAVPTVLKALGVKVVRAIKWKHYPDVSDLPDINYVPFTKWVTVKGKKLEDVNAPRLRKHLAEQLVRFTVSVKYWVEDADYSEGSTVDEHQQRSIDEGSEEEAEDISVRVEEDDEEMDEEDNFQYQLYNISGQKLLGFEIQPNGPAATCLRFAGGADTVVVPYGEACWVQNARLLVDLKTPKEMKQLKFVRGGTWQMELELCGLLANSDTPALVCFTDGADFVVMWAWGASFRYLHTLPGQSHKLPGGRCSRTKAFKFIAHYLNKVSPQLTPDVDDEDTVPAAPHASESNNKWLTLFQDAKKTFGDAEALEEQISTLKLLPPDNRLEAMCQTIAAWRASSALLDFSEPRDSSAWKESGMYG